MVTVAEILKNNKLANEQSKPATVSTGTIHCNVPLLFRLMISEICTGLDAFNDDGRERAVQKPKMEVVLHKSESFDEAMVQHTRPSAVNTGPVSAPK